MHCNNNNELPSEKSNEPKTDERWGKAHPHDDDELMQDQEGVPVIGPEQDLEVEEFMEDAIKAPTGDRICKPLRPLLFCP